MRLREVLFGASVDTVVPATFRGGAYSGNNPSQRRDGTGDTLTAQIRALLDKHLATTAPSGLPGKALTYLAGQWPKLNRYVENEAWPIDNNPCESAVRPFVVGRRAWLFADTTGAAKASANLDSLVETCKANGVDAYRYLTGLFKALPYARSADDYAALLPWKLGQRRGDTAA